MIDMLLNFSLSAKRALNARSLPGARCFKKCQQRLGVALQYLLLAVLSNVGVKDIFGSEYFRIYKNYVNKLYYYQNRN